MRNYKDNFEKQIWLHEYNGYSPFYLGIGYGDYLKLGSEEFFLHCADWTSGVCDIEFWIKEHLDNLTTKPILDKIYCDISVPKFKPMKCSNGSLEIIENFESLDYKKIFQNWNTSLGI